MMTIPPELEDALPSDTDLSRCTITTYGALDRVSGNYSAPADDAIVVILPGWVADDGNAPIEFPEAESGDEAAQEYVDSGEWGEIEETHWFTVHSWRVGYMLDDGDVVKVSIDRDRHHITVNPNEPDCDGEHDHNWLSPYSLLGGLEENPGVWGHGGGVITKEACGHCGKYKVTDTWATNPENGEQGLHSVAYENADEDSLAWMARRLAALARDVSLPDGYTFQRGTEDRMPRLVRDDDDSFLRLSDDDLREIVERQSWDAIIEQFPAGDRGGTMRKCKYCGHGIWPRNRDENQHFCTMRCAACYGIERANDLENAESRTRLANRDEP